MILFKKVFSMSSLVFCLIFTIPLSASFIPLNEDDKALLSTKYRVPFERITTVEAEKVQSLPQEFKNNVNPFVLTSNLVEIGKTEKEVILSFEPHAIAPRVVIPAGFPLDMHGLILNYLSNQELNLDEYDINFGQLEGDATILGTNHKIGSWVERYSFSPPYFLKQFFLRARMLSKISLLLICQRNADLMETACYIFEEQDKNLNQITWNSVRELSKLLAYTLGINVLNNPEPKVSLQMNNFKIPTRGKMKARKYKRMLKERTRNFLLSLNLTYDSEKGTLVRKVA